MQHIINTHLLKIITLHNDVAYVSFVNKVVNATSMLRLLYVTRGDWVKYTHNVTFLSLDTLQLQIKREELIELKMA